jgi:AcrR family transcriptional regulator
MVIIDPTFTRSIRCFVSGAIGCSKVGAVEPRPPYDLDGIVAVGNALCLGAYVGHVLDPDLMTVERFAYGITSTVMVGARLKGDNRTMDDRLAEMNYYPRTASHTARPVFAADGGTRERFVQAAAELFAEHGVEATSVGLPARRVGVSPSTFFNLYKSKNQVALALLDRYAELHMSVRPDRCGPADTVMEHLVATAEITTNHEELARILLGELAADDTGRVGATFIDPLIELLAAMPGVDRVDEKDVISDLAQAMITLVVQRMLRRPGFGAASAARWALRLLPDQSPRTDRRPLQPAES